MENYEIRIDIQGNHKPLNDKAFFFGGTNTLNAKGKPNNKENTNFYNPKQNEKTMRSYEPSSSKKYKKRGKEKTMFSYFGIVFHLEISCIKNTID